MFELGHLHLSRVTIILRSSVGGVAKRVQQQRNVIMCFRVLDLKHNLQQLINQYQTWLIICLVASTEIKVKLYITSA